MFKSKSKELSEELRHNDFKETDGWLPRWKCKFGAELNKANGEKVSVDAVSAQQCK
jgi:hypothetical protein